MATFASPALEFFREFSSFRLSFTVANSIGVTTGGGTKLDDGEGKPGTGVVLPIPTDKVRVGLDVWL